MGGAAWPEALLVGAAAARLALRTALSSPAELAPDGLAQLAGATVVEQALEA
jgi:hypothetical protein